MNSRDIERFIGLLGELTTSSTSMAAELASALKKGEEADIVQNSLNRQLEELTSQHNKLEAKFLTVSRIGLETERALKDLVDSKAAIEKRLEESQGHRSNQEAQHPHEYSEALGRNLVIGIADISKKNEEAVFDALSAFDKKCPYCGKDQYQIGIREKIEIDHFIPVARGGQDVPWNLLPVCKECNRKKKARLPFDFLKPEVFSRCQTYLHSVRQRYYDGEITAYQSFAHLRSLVESNLEFINNNISNEFIRDVAIAICPDLVNVPDGISLKSTENVGVIGGSFLASKDYLYDQIRGRKGEFSRGVVMGPWSPLCERLRWNSPNKTLQINPQILFQLLIKDGWRDMGKIMSQELTTRKHIFCAPEMRGFSKSEIRRIGERALDVES